MRIIKKRNNHLKKFAIWDCKNCGSTIESTQHEGYYQVEPQGDYIITKCPVCEEANHLPAKIFIPRADEGPFTMPPSNQ